MNVWAIIVILGVLTYLTRFAFLGLVGNRPLPAWFERHLRYTAVSILPALAVPLVVWPDAVGTAPELARLVAAGAALGVAAWRRDAIAGVIAGGLVMVLVAAFQ